MAAGAQNNIAEMPRENGEGGEEVPPRHANDPPAVENLRQDNDAEGEVHNWQASKRTVKERLRFLFNNEILSDVRFIVGRDPNKQTIPAHKFVLSIGSAVFDAMFNGGLATDADAVEIPDVEPFSFFNLIKFLYSDDVIIDPEGVMTTLYTAKKYAVTAVEERCVDFLKANLGIDNAFLLLTQARLFDEPQLAGHCLAIIDKYTSETMNAEGFTDIDINTLNAVLQRDTLRAREAIIFAAVVRWAGAECVRRQLPVTPANKRAVLGRIFDAIRFPLMTVGEFAAGPALSGLLADAEALQLFMHYTLEPRPPVGYSDARRCVMTGTEFAASRFPQTDSRWGYSGSTDRIKFTVSKRIYVAGFGLYAAYVGLDEYEVRIQIIHASTKDVCASTTTMHTRVEAEMTFRVMFREPVEVLPGHFYIACAKIKGGDSYCGSRGMRRVSVDCGSGDKVYFVFSKAIGNSNGTTVEDGQIPTIFFYV